LLHVLHVEQAEQATTLLMLFVDSLVSFRGEGQPDMAQLPGVLLMPCCCPAGRVLPVPLLILLLQSLVGISSSFITNAAQPGGELTRQLTGTETLKCVQQRGSLQDRLAAS
jgi:hypothetical protein